MIRKVLSLAIPSIVTNITVPLLSLVDMAIVGHLGSPAYIGAISVGGLAFNILYWNFGFLRMGTSGLASQAYGKRDFEEMLSVFIRALQVAFFLASIFVIFREGIAELAFSLVDADDNVKNLAKTYFLINIWAAPAVLGLYSFKGWYIGMQNSRFPMYVAISLNVINIILSLLFVYCFNMGLRGVALGSAIAQYCGLAIAVLLWGIYYRRKLMSHYSHKLFLSVQGFGKFFKLNAAIALRTMCLVTVTTFFTIAGAKQGVVVLAVNSLMMQLFTLFSYFMDGFAYAAEALVGKYTGAKDNIELKNAIKAIFKWGGVVSLFFTFLYLLCGSSFLAMLSDETSVIEECQKYKMWVMAIPLAGFAAFLWDGVCVGATAVKPMVWAMIIATCTFFISYYLMIDIFENHAIWMSFLNYLFMRGVVQTIWASKTIFYTRKI